MADEVVHTDGGGSGATAVVIVLLVIVLLAVLYFTGVFGRMFGSKETKINVDVNKPGIVLPLG